MDAWVQGMRPTGTHSRPWQQIIFDRVTGAYDEVPGGHRTSASEVILGIAAHSYVFLDFISPKYSEYLVAHKPKPLRDAWGAFGVTPFDTGGVAQGHIPTNMPPRMTVAELVEKHTYRSNRFLRAFHRWIRAAYPQGLAAYIDGKPPAAHTVAEIAYQLATDSRAWLWEGRLRSAGYDKHPLPVMHILFRSGEWAEYERWVEMNVALTVAEATTHLARMSRLAVIVDAPAVKMRSMLLGRGRAWLSSR